MTDPRIEAAARALFGDRVDDCSGAREYLFEEVGKALAAADAAAWRPIDTAPMDGTQFIVAGAYWQPLPIPPTHHERTGERDG